MGLLALGAFAVQAAALAPLPLAEALRLALNQNPDIQASTRQVDAARARFMQTQGEFDLLLSSGVNYHRSITPFIDTSLPVNSYGQTWLLSTGYTLGLSQPLRNGMSLVSTLNAASLEARDPSAPVRPRQNAVKLDVSLMVPLLAGRGRTAATAAEDVARINALAGNYGLRERAARTLYETMLAYWEYRARVELEQVAVSSVERSAQLLDSIQRLVDTSERPRADLVLLKADLADKVVAREAAALARADARSALGRLLGLDAAAIEVLPAPNDPFPAAAGAAADLATLRAAAASRRPELRALALQLQAMQREVDAARNRRLPQLNLEMGMEYLKVSQGGSRYGFAGVGGHTQTAPTVFARLNYAFPLQNRGASGALQERLALLAELEVRQRDLVTGVAAGVDNAMRALVSGAEQVRTARDSLALYETAVKQEITKQRNGIATLIDVINTEARFVNARVNLLGAQLAYANALARLRYESGLLLPVPASDEASADPIALDVAELTGPLFLPRNQD